MKKYFSCYNNGVTALVSEEVYNNLKKQASIQRLFTEREKDVTFNEQWRTETSYQGLRHLLVPIFTFTRVERFGESPWFTGDINFLNELHKHIEENGGVVESSGFFVPFSNGCEVGIHGKDAMKNELAYVTTEQQFREAFGISVSEIEERSRVAQARLAQIAETVQGVVERTNKQDFEQLLVAQRAQQK